MRCDVGAQERYEALDRSFPVAAVRPNYPKPLSLMSLLSARGLRCQRSCTPWPELTGASQICPVKAVTRNWSRGAVDEGPTRFPHVRAWRSCDIHRPMRLAVPILLLID